MPPRLTSSCLKPPPRDVLSIIDRNWEDLLSSKDEFRFESFLQAQLEEGQDEFQNIFAIHDIHAYCIIRAQSAWPCINMRAHDHPIHKYNIQHILNNYGMNRDSSHLQFDNLTSCSVLELLRDIHFSLFSIRSNWIPKNVTVRAF